MTFQIETALAGATGLEYTRSLSRNGFSQVTAVFSDKTDIYFARQQVNERLREARSTLPMGAEPRMGPISTGLGEIYMWSVAFRPKSGPGASEKEFGWRRDGSYLTPEGQKLTTDIAAGTNADLSIIGTRWLIDFVQQGIAEPLDGYITPEFKDRFIDTFLSPSVMEGKTYGLPIAASARSHQGGPSVCTRPLSAAHPILVGMNRPTAIRLIDGGARFIATNPDATGPTPSGVVPATGAVAALITKATGREPYVVGKPNPMMFRSALNKIGAHSEETGMIGDRMDTDIIAGMEAGLHTVLVLTGLTTEADVAKYPFRPNQILNGVHELVDQV